MKIKKRLLALLLCAVMVLGMIPFISGLTADAVVVSRVAGLSRKAAAEGIVLLQNNNNVLPLSSAETVSVFGRIQVNYFNCGYGSGGDVKYPYTINLLQGMRNNPAINVYEPLARVYETWCAANPPNNGSWGNWPRFHEEMVLDNAVVANAAANSDTAVVVIGRSAGEDRESTLTKGSYYLTDKEIALLDQVTANFDKIVVIMNVGNVVDMEWLDTYPQIDSVVFAWQGGMEAGNAVADVLSGDETPSGKLAATIAKTYQDYPSSDNFAKPDYTNYIEDIYVGYRYFETFTAARDRVKYGFGFGLSYTTFDIVTNSVTTRGEGADKEIVVDVTVKNTGGVKGKEVIQVYYGAPQGQLGKAAKSLAAYAKTNLLQPGGQETIQIAFKVDGMASYDDSGVTGHKSAYVMEAGDYPIYIGNSVRESVQKGVYSEPALRVTEQLEEAMSVYPADRAFNRLRPAVDGNTITEDWSDSTPVRSYSIAERITEEMSGKSPDLPYGQADQGFKLIDVYKGDCTMEEYMAQMSLQNIADLTRGAGAMGHSRGRCAGNASVFGAVTNGLDGFGIPRMSSTDGPSGVRMTASASLIPIGTTLACTWNNKLVEQLYAGIGEEMRINFSDTLLAPGMNLQRDPLCGRNFEYFSEDPLVTGMMGASTVKGVQSQGVGSTPKHFAANNQETNRHTNYSMVSERALREIYLKGFEICIDTANPQNIMMSYNRVNGVQAHYSYDLATKILREQWGYDGMVMTDWWITSGTDPDFGLTDNAYRIRGGIDVLMPGENSTNGNPVTAVNNGTLNVGEVQRSAKRTLEFALKSARFRLDNNLPLYDYAGELETLTPAFTVVQAEQREPSVDMIYIDGKALAGFSPITAEYRLFKRDLTTLPTVTAEAADDVTLDIAQATVGKTYATVTATLPDGGEKFYRVFWTNEAGIDPIDPNAVYAYLNNVYVNGEPMLNFYQGLYNYTVWVDDPADVTFTADVPDGVDYSVTRDGDIVVIRAESDYMAREYTFKLDYFTPLDPRYLPQSDEFDAGDLNSFWTVGGQTANYSKEDGYVQIVTEGGDWYTSATEQKNYVWQHAGGNWTSVTKVSYDIKPFQSYHQMGVMVYQDSNNFLQWRLEYNNWDGNQPNPLRFSLANETNGSNSATTNTALPQQLPDGAHTLLFRVQKTGNVYRFDVSIDDGANWTNVGGNVTKVMAEPKFSLLALSGSVSDDANDRITCQYDYVRFSDVEDPIPQTPIVPVVSIDGDAVKPEDGRPTVNKVKVATDNFYMTTSNLRTENCSDWDTGRNVGYTAGGEYLLYNLDVSKAGWYDATVRYAGGNSGVQQYSFSLHTNGERAATYNFSGGTGGWQSWRDHGPQKIYLNAGLNKLMFRCDTGGFNANYISLFRVLNTDRLQPLYDQVAALNPYDYTDDSWAPAGTALVAAKTLLENGTPDDQAAVDAAYENLKAAYDALVASEALESLRVQERDANLHFSSGWGLRAQIGRFDEHMAKQASKIGASMSFDFFGSYFEIIGYRSYSQGRFDVYIDGEKVTETPIDLYEPGADASFKIPVFSKEILKGPHSVNIVTVPKNPKSIGNNMYIDAVEITGYFIEPVSLVDDQAIIQSDAPVEIDVLANDSVSGTPEVAEQPASGTVEWDSAKKLFIFTPTAMSVKDDSFIYSVGDASATVTLTYADSIRYEETFAAVEAGKNADNAWTSHKFAAYSGGSAIRSGKKDDYIELTFYGTGIDIIGYKSWSRGIVEITLDGVSKLVDTHDMSYDKHYKFPIYKSGLLAEGTHTLKIRVTGDRFFLASGSAIDIDAFVVNK